MVHQRGKAGAGWKLEAGPQQSRQSTLFTAERPWEEARGNSGGTYEQQPAECRTSMEKQSFPGAQVFTNTPVVAERDIGEGLF